MRCYYEILGVPRDANDDELKKSYRKLALQWHPDKNLANSEEATEQFRLIQQAYEVLIDPQERAWYDKHREAILKGGLGENYKDNSLDVFQYFTGSCYSGYHDNEKGFYMVYREVFSKIASEDLEFADVDRESAPDFGFSYSSYEDVVHPFYAYWQSYCTTKSYTWLDKYDIRDAPNRRVLRLMEKENKKIRDTAKRKRNEEIRALVLFVRKRDKRVQAFKKLLEEKAAENARKAEENRRKQLEDRRRCLENYQESDCFAMSQVEDILQEIEANISHEFGDVTITREDGEQDSDKSDCNESELYCIACDKAFKSDRAFENHEKSKKHKENAAILKKTMHEEENLFFTQDDEHVQHLNSNNEILDGTDSEDDFSISKRKLKKKKKKNRLKLKESSPNSSIDSSIEDVSSPNSTNIEANVVVENNKTDEVVSVEPALKEAPPAPSKMKRKDKEAKKNVTVEMESVDKISAEDLRCSVCGTVFPSRNKLFDHLKKTGHAVPLNSNGVVKKEEKTTSKKKGKR